jgi:hypothetical protein
MDRALKLVGGYFQYFLENEALALMIYAHQNIDPMRCHFFGADIIALWRLWCKGCKQRCSPFSTRGRRHRRPTKAYH